MVLTNGTPPTTPTTTTPDSDNDTPPRTQPIRQFPVANGTTNNHPCHHHHHQPPPLAPVTYKECLKNHVANLGGHVLDGCGEFMPSINANANEPATITCAACGCHRNFHRRELDGYSPFMSSVTPHLIDFRQPRRSSSSPSPPPRPPQQQQQQPTVIPYPPTSQMLLALSTVAQEDQQVPNNQYTVITPLTPRDAKAAEQNSSGRKRFRTKFSQEQKEKMHSFAESMGWKMQKSDQNEVENFCNEIGVAKGVLKVWMHNHKNATFGSKKDISNHPTNTTTADDENANIGINGGRVSLNENRYKMNRSLDNDGDGDGDGDGDDDNNMASGNGSSPSS